VREMERNGELVLTAEWAAREGHTPGPSLTDQR
jgi:hypothetical protein